MIVLACASLALLVPTGSFSAASVDRGVSVSVAEHENAMVSIWDPGGSSPDPPKPFRGENPVTPNSEFLTVIVIQNGVDDPIDVSVTSTADSSVSVHGTISDVHPGDVVPVQATVDCNDVSERAAVTVPLRVHVETDDGSFESTIRYDVRIVCAGAPGNASNAGQPTNSANATQSNGTSAAKTSTNSSTATAPTNAT
jgi:hypothetical protein